MRETDHFVSLLTDRLPTALAFVGLDRRIRVANPAFCAWYGLDPSDTRGRLMNDLLEDKEYERLAPAVERVFGGERIQIELSRHPGNGSGARTIRECLHPAKSDGGKIRAGFVWSIEDITEQREAEAELRQAYKMHAIGNLTGGIAHDFNNLNAVVIGNLELLEDNSLTAEQSTLLSDALSASYRSAELTRDLLSFAQKAPLRPETIAATERFASLEPLLRTSLPEYLEFEIRIAPDSGAVNVDRTGFENAVLNLVLNARDAVDSKTGQILIDVSPVDIGSGEDFPGEAFAGDTKEPPAGAYLAISVIDNGAGVSAAIRPTMLEPFATTKGPAVGSGLGLSMVHGFVRQSGGYLLISDRAGPGTVVTLYLPRVADNAGTETAPVPERRTVRVSGRPFAVVVEDEAAVRRLLVRRLGTLGFSVVDFANADEAVQHFSGDRQIDLLLTDAILTGGLQGTDLARMARKLQPGIKVILASGYPSTQFEREAAEVFDRFVSKPFTQETLTAAIEACMPLERIIRPATAATPRANGA